ncbi:MAG: hypothetical protein KJ792_00780 [Actinobacteria bacterium]|nr:hypothetical protein [Actinomycetota bacterium]MCG2802741.1 hypothetical protein [Cellulomonas sp.]
MARHLAPAHRPVTAAPAAGPVVPLEPTAPATAWRLLVAPTDGRRVPGTLVITAGAACLVAIDLAARLLLTGIGRPATIVLLALAAVAAATGVYRVAARLAAPRPVRLAAALAVALVPLWPSPATAADAALLAGSAGCAAGIAHLASSARRFSGGEIAVFAGLPAALAALSGPAGWTAVGIGLLVVAAVGASRHLPARRIGVLLTGLASTPVLAVAGWTWRTGALPQGAGWGSLVLIGVVLGLVVTAGALVRRIGR